SDSRKLITCRSTGEFRLWDVATGRQLQEFTPRNGTRNRAEETKAALSPDGKLLASIEPNEERVPTPGKVEWKARISLWDTATGKPVRQLVCPAHEIVSGSGHGFSALTFTSDGKSLITAGGDHMIRVWETSTGEELRRLPLHGLPTSSLALSRDGTK